MGTRNPGSLAMGLWVCTSLLPEVQGHSAIRLVRTLLWREVCGAGGRARLARGPKSPAFSGGEPGSVTQGGRAARRRAEGLGGPRGWGLVLEPTSWAALSQSPGILACFPVNTEELVFELALPHSGVGWLWPPPCPPSPEPPAPSGGLLGRGVTEGRVLSASYLSPPPQDVSASGTNVQLGQRTSLFS